MNFVTGLAGADTLSGIDGADTLSGDVGADYHNGFGVTECSANAHVAAALVAGDFIN